MILSEQAQNPPAVVQKAVQVKVKELIYPDETDSSSRDNVSKPPSYHSHLDSSPSPASTNNHHIVKVAQWSKLTEGLKITRQILDHTLLDTLNRKPCISQLHQYTRRIVNPLFTWGGKNTRVLSDHSPGSTSIRDGDSHRRVIHAASHNYMGFYRSTPESEALHHLALQHLPVASVSDQSAMRDAFHRSLADFFSADFAVTTSTGYASNSLAFPAILSRNWIVILDEKSHNSMNVGCYLSDVPKTVRFRHNDMDHLEALLVQHRHHKAEILVAVEGLYSMDGTIPPLHQLASLKHRLNFVLLVDEAHSFLSVGSTGHGCVELWNDTHPDHPVDFELIDIRTATLSKSLASIGGVVCGKARFTEAMQDQMTKLGVAGAGPVLTATMIQCIHILNQPCILRQRLARMKDFIAFTRQELHRFGIHVYGDACTPLLLIHCGPPSRASEMSYVLRSKGILATPVSKPAVGFWESRIRVCLSADHTDEMINLLVRGIIEAAQEIGISKKMNLPPRTFRSTNTVIQRIENDEAALSFHDISELIERDRRIIQRVSFHQDMIESGHLARQKFGIATGGSRWISGTFTVHEDLESLLALTTGLPDALTYSDNYIGLSSTIAALCRPLKSHNKHDILIPQNACKAMLDGLIIAPKKHRPTVQRYSDLLELDVILEMYNKSLASRSHQITLVLSFSEMKAKCSSPQGLQLFQNSKRRILPGLTIMIYGFDEDFRGCRGQEEVRNVIALLKTRSKDVIAYGSFYESFGVPGAYLAGTAEMIEELRYSSRGYMFSTAPLPFTTAMNLQRLEQAISL